jgi:hypothetical protein
VIPFIAGVFTGTFLGVVVLAVVGGNKADACQLPTLGTGTWLVGIDAYGELNRCEPHVCFEASVKRLLDEGQS